MKANVIIIAPTGAGKSTLARNIAEQAIDIIGPIRIIEGSQWIRTITGRWDHGSDIGAFLAKESKKRLDADPLCSLRILQNAVVNAGCRPTVVVGLRNPTDFVGLYDPVTTMVVIIQGESKFSWEEEGLSKIMSILDMVKSKTLILPKEFWKTENSAIDLIIDHLNK